MAEFVKNANIFNLEDFPFELHEGSLPVIGSRYYHFVKSGSICSNGKLVEQVLVHWIQIPYHDTAQEICYALVSESTDQIYKPITSDSWIKLIYTWVNPIDGLMKPNELDQIYITRSVYIEKDPETASLKKWAGKQHYIEYLGGPEPEPVCACCAGTRIPKPSDEEFINSTHTKISVSKPDYKIGLDGKNLHFKLANGNQNKISISYDGVKLYFKCENWVNNESCGKDSVYLSLYEGYEFLHNNKVASFSSDKKVKITYPEWVTPNTIWTSSGPGGYSYKPKCEYAFVMCEKGAHDYTNNNFIVNIFNQVKQIYQNTINLIPQDISGDRSKYEADIKLNTERMIKYINIIGLDEIKNKIEQFVNSNDMFDQLAQTLNNINPIKLGLNNRVEHIDSTILELVNKYYVNIVNSPDVIIQPKYDFYERKTWTARSIVNSHFVELHVTCLVNSKSNYDLDYVLYADSEEEAKNKCVEKINKMIDSIWPTKNKVYLEKQKWIQSNEEVQEIKVNTIIIG